MATQIQAPAPLLRGPQMPSKQPSTSGTLFGSPLDDDIVPSLPSELQPPAFSTQEVDSHLNEVPCFS